MHAKKQQIAVMLVAAGLGLANAGVQAHALVPPDQGRTSETEPDTSKPQDPESYYRPDRSKPADPKHGQQIKASKLIGKEVKNDQGEQLGKVEDLIISSSYAVKFAVISSGGTLGVGEKCIAVPINNLNCSGDGNITLSATADQLKNASKTPTGTWVAVSGEEWTRDIDGYYGQPEEFSMTEPRGYSQPARTFERETVGTSLEREPVRAVQGNGARQLITHPDHANLFAEPLFGKAPKDRSRAPATDTSDETMPQRVSDSQPARTFERETADASLEREPVRAVQGNGARQLITHPDHANLFDEPIFGKAPTDNSRAPATDTSDETMQQRISDSLQQISIPGNPQTVSVAVQNGIVTLRGTVADAAEKRNIETTVKQMSGVRRVNNQLTLQSR